MLAILSPAKLMNPEPSRLAISSTPMFAPRADELSAHLAKLSAQGLRDKLQISDSLAKENKQRYAQWAHGVSQPQPGDAGFHAAATLFNGPAYVGLDASSLTEEELGFAQEHVRLLSGIYGVLRPADLIQKYRLCMGTKDIAYSGHKTLYQFWGTSVTEHIVNHLMGMPTLSDGNRVLLNVASDEYSKVVDFNEVRNAGVVIVTCKFRTGGRSGPVLLKKARGLMARWASVNPITALGDLDNFDLAGYRLVRKDVHPKRGDVTLEFDNAGAPPPPSAAASGRGQGGKRGTKRAKTGEPGDDSPAANAPAARKRRG